MRRWFAVIAIGCIAAGCGSEGRRSAATASPTAEVTSATSPPTPTATPLPTPDQSVFDVERAMAHVRALSVTIGNRQAGTEGDRRGTDYIAGEIRKLGWRAEKRPFPLPQGGQSWNVVGTPPGFDEREPYLLVGGHHDSINGPGANDNATGIAVMLEIARAVDVRAAPLPVMAVAFGAEERQPVPGRVHHVGSRHYVAGMSQEARRNLVAMVNVDMVGHGDLIYCGTLASGPREGTRRCVDQANRIGVAARERVTPDWSDHGSFQREGMNIAWLWTGENPCCYHNPRDTIQTVRPSDVSRSGRLALAIVRSYTR